MRCEHCGHRNGGDANFCSSCGTALEHHADVTETLAAITGHPPNDGHGALAPGEVPVGLGALLVIRGPNAGSQYVLTAEITEAGRHPESEIFLDDITVSRRHAEIRKSGSTYSVADVGSLNGTYLNSERVEVGDLTDRDEIQIGRFRLLFFIGTGASDN